MATVTKNKKATKKGLGSQSVNKKTRNKAASSKSAEDLSVSYDETRDRLLEDPEIALLYFQECLSEGDPSLIMLALRQIAKLHPEGISGVAKKTKRGRTSLYKTLSKDGNPHLDTFFQILESLDIQITAK